MYSLPVVVRPFCRTQGSLGFTPPFLLGRNIFRVHRVCMNSPRVFKKTPVWKKLCALVAPQNFWRPIITRFDKESLSPSRKKTPACCPMGVVKHESSLREGTHNTRVEPQHPLPSPNLSGLKSRRNPLPFRNGGPLEKGNEPPTSWKIKAYNSEHNFGPPETSIYPNFWPTLEPCLPFFVIRFLIIG